MAKKEIALRKHQQIAKTNKHMFIWVAAASVIIGVAVVASIFLVQRAVFKEKVLGVKEKTASTLQQNNRNVNELKDNVRAINSNDDLRKVMIEGGTEPIQVVLDALPSTANSSALGASLQQKLLNDPAIRIESLTVEPVVGIEDTVSSAATSGQGTGSDVINFAFSVSADAQNPNVLREVLKKLEYSIRTIKVKKAIVERQGNRITLTCQAEAYFQPEKTVELKSESVAP